VRRAHAVLVMALTLAPGGLAASSARAADPRQVDGKTAGCTARQGQIYIDTGRYDRALREFSCVIDGDPTGVEGYRGRIEAELLLGRFSDAVRTYTRVTAFVEPVHPDVETTILAGYDARLARNPVDVAALTGSSFALWYYFDYAAAIHTLNKLLEFRPDNLYGNLFRGSSRMLRGRNAGTEDIERALQIDPVSPHVRYVVADAFTYGSPADPQRAFDEATLALEGGLDTPRVHAILASSLLAFGDLAGAGEHIERHFELVTTDLVPAPELVPGGTVSVDEVPGRAHEIPLQVTAGETLSIATSSHDFYDTILVLIGPDGTPVLGSDDFAGYFAGFDWVAPATGRYTLRVTFFESVIYGQIQVTRR
jgi:tetratricopeptide (TPR) repeat protein